MKSFELLKLLENFGGFEKMSKPDIEYFNVEEPKFGPVLMAPYKGNKEVILVLGVDPDEGKIRVAVDNPNKGSSHVKYFNDDEAGYKEAKKYADSLRPVKINDGLTKADKIDRSGPNPDKAKSGSI